LRDRNARLLVSRHWDEHGLELFWLGTWAVSGACLTYLFDQIPLLAMVACAVVAWCLRLVLLKIWIRPRAGYVKFCWPKGWLWKYSLLVISLPLIAVIEILIWGDEAKAMSAMTGGVFFAVMFAVFAFAFRFQVYYWFAVASLAGGIVGAWLDLGPEGMLASLLAWGSTMLIVGSLRLKHFISTHPVQEEGVHGQLA